MSPNHSSSDRFASIFGRQPSVTVRAPGRINLIGEHVDYQGGLVMPAAIDRYVFGAARAIPELEVRLWSSSTDSRIDLPLDLSEPLEGDQHWANYVFGVIAKYREAGHPVTGLELAFDADLPSGAGLSSSAALESATAIMVEAMSGFELTPVERALLCQSAEHDWAGVPCGIMDQLAVNAGVAGHAMKIDCRSLEIQLAALPKEIAIVVVDSKVRHALADGEYAKRKLDCEAAANALEVENLRDVGMAQLQVVREALGDRVFRRARHVVTEIERVEAFARALDVADVAAAGSLMAASHRSLCEDFEVSCPELDALVKIASELGAIGSRMVGGGFGGSTVNLIERTSAQAFADQTTARYRELCGGEVASFIVSPVDGAKAEAS